MYRSSILPLVGAIVLYAVNIINGHSVLQNSSPIVCISDGCIEGQLTPGYRIDHFESFFNIPFAQPPVGKLRFAVSFRKCSHHEWFLHTISSSCAKISLYFLFNRQNPVPNQPWKNVLDGKHERKRNCAQKNLLVPEPKFEGVEDCLYLSVFRPAVSWNAGFTATNIKCALHNKWNIFCLLFRMCRRQRTHRCR